ncbi:hypothetical protein niasHT_009221 [Heterodera trifolii]|uniref:Uncharacterized protein n=1 Tax=Heterodera trifolii TaxID=157864 RepID=A0ABD2LYT0_9BILA
MSTVFHGHHFASIQRLSFHGIRFGHQNVIVYAKVADYHCPRVQIVTAKEQLELINGNYDQLQKINVTINWLRTPEETVKMARKKQQAMITIARRGSDQ